MCQGPGPFHPASKADGVITPLGGKAQFLGKWGILRPPEDGWGCSECSFGGIFLGEVIPAGKGSWVGFLIHEEGAGRGRGSRAGKGEPSPGVLVCTGEAALGQFP